ncbi:MAG: hypothetical protein ACHQ1F_01070 [Spirochaetia bacterium]
MKKIICSAAIILAVCAGAFGLGGVSLQNQENATFYYTVDPKELAGLSTGSPLLASRIAGFFAARDGVTFASLAPNATVKLEGLADGSHLLVGFFAVEDLTQYPVRVITLQADSTVGDRFYAIFASPALLSIAKDSGRIASFAHAGGQGNEGDQTGAIAAGAATQPAPAETAPSGLQQIASFSTGFTPAYFTREKQGDFTVLPISDSRAWALTGTRIQSVSGSLADGELKISLSVEGGFAEKVSYFLYVFGTRSPGKDNQFTLELQPRAQGGRAVCLLWQKDIRLPLVVGNVTATDNTVELDTTAGQFPPSLLSRLGPSATVDLTAGWFDRGLGTWEEFYYTTFSMGDITVIR